MKRNPLGVVASQSPSTTTTTSQAKYLNLAKVGEHVVLKSRVGSFRIFPDDGSGNIETSRDLMKELKNALTEVKEVIAGKRKLQSADSLLNELYITILVSGDFAQEAKRLAKKYPSLKQDYKVFLVEHDASFA